MQVVKSKQLVALIADRTDLFQYEIEQAMTVLTNVIAEQLQQGNAVKLDSLLTISPKINKPKTFIDPRTNEPSFSKGSIGIKTKAAGWLTAQLNLEKSVDFSD